MTLLALLTGAFAIAAALAYPFVVRRLVLSGTPEEDAWSDRFVSTLGAATERFDGNPASDVQERALRRLRGIVSNELKNGTEYSIWAALTSDGTLKARLEAAAEAEFRNAVRAAEWLGRLSLDAEVRRPRPDSEYSTEESDAGRWEHWRKSVSGMSAVMDGVTALAEEPSIPPGLAAAMREHVASEWRTFHSLDEYRRRGEAPA